jgi:hypothetical protein
LQSVAKDSQSEARRLASAIDTLNSDRDRLYSRVTVLEQGLDSVTGSIARQYSAAGSPQPAASRSGASEPAASPPQPAPVTAAPATTLAALTDKPREAATRQPEAIPANSTASTEQKAANPPAATPLMPSKSIMAPPDAAAAKLIVPEQPPEVITATPAPETVATASPASDPAVSNAAGEIAVQRTEFGVDLGAANSIDGLRALWRGLLNSNATLASLRPIIVVRERNNGLGMQLRLVAGPLSDAAAAAKICAALIESERPCTTSLFDGQRLAVNSGDPVPPAPARPVRKRAAAKRVSSEEQPAQPKPSTMSSTLGAR